MTAVPNLPTEAINYSRAPEITAAPGDVVKLADAAVALDMKLGTLRRLVGEGLPVVRRANAKGGRGGGTLLHVPTVRAWLAAQKQPAKPVEALLLALASELPAVVGSALDEAGRLCEGQRKAELLRLLPGVWFLASTAVRDHLVEVGCPPQRDLTRDDLPPALARLLDSELKSKRLCL